MVEVRNARALPIPSSIRNLLVASFMFLLFGCAACERHPAASNATPQPTAAISPTSPPLDPRPKLVAFGDSFTSGFGIDDVRKNYPSLLQDDLDKAGFDLQVINRGRAGDTSTQGLARLDEALSTGEVRIFILELGGNDVFKKVPITETRASLENIIKGASDRGAKVLLCGYVGGDPATAKARSDMFADLAAENHVVLLRSFMDGVADHPDLLLPDGVHPNEAGARVIEQKVWAALQPLLTSAPRKKK